MRALFALLLLCASAAAQPYNAWEQGKRTIEQGPVIPTCRMGNGFPDDGCTGAAHGPIQYPHVFDQALFPHNTPYPVRPPWNVAGVDYHVGAPDNIVFKNPLSDLPANCATFSPGNNTVRISGDGSGNCTLDGFDFTVNGGISVQILGTATGMVTINNSIFAIGPGVGCCGGPLIGQQPYAGGAVGGGVTMKWNTYNGNGFPGPGSGHNVSAFLQLDGCGTLDFEYNYMYNLDVDGVDIDACGGGGGVINSVDQVASTITFLGTITSAPSYQFVTGSIGTTGSFYQIVAGDTLTTVAANLATAMTAAGISGVSSAGPVITVAGATNLTGHVYGGTPWADVEQYNLFKNLGMLNLSHPDPIQYICSNATGTVRQYNLAWNAYGESLSSGGMEDSSFHADNACEQFGLISNLLNQTGRRDTLLAPGTQSATGSNNNNAQTASVVIAPIRDSNSLCPLCPGHSVLSGYSYIENYLEYTGAFCPFFGTCFGACGCQPPGTGFTFTGNINLMTGNSCTPPPVGSPPITLADCN